MKIALDKLELWRLELSSLNYGNLLITGSTALILCGLDVKEPEDLDVVIYNPNKVQRSMLEDDAWKCIKSFPDWQTQEDPDAEYEAEFSETNVGNYKYTHPVVPQELNVFVAYDPMPDFLTVPYDMSVKFLPVNEVLKYKLNYRDRRGNPRLKDVLHMQQIIANNFTF